MKRLFTVLLSGLVLILGQGYAMASDLDDGITKYTDDAIAADDELGKPGKNIKFIIEKSKSQAKVSENNSGKGNTKTGSNSGDNNRNSVVMGAGSNIRGDIIIIDNSKDSD
jgi:hypothetical protein